MSLESLGNSAVEFAQAHPLVVDGLIIAGAAIALIGLTRFGLRQLGVLS